MQQQVRSYLSTGSSCAIWLSYIVVVDQVWQAIPWVILLGGLLFSTLIRWLHAKQELQLYFEPASILLAHPKTATKQQTGDRSLAEITAPIVALISIALPVVLLSAYLVLHIDLTQPHKPIKHRQVVEIELVALTDAIDHKDILPATSKEIVSKAQKGALYTVASSALSGAHVPLSKPKLEQKPTKLEAKPEPQLATRPLTFKAPDNWKTIVVAKEKDKSVDFSSYSASAVEPANMIESIDSDGQLSPLLIQTGGRSKMDQGPPLIYTNI